MIQAPQPPLDIHLGLELQRAVAERNGDRAVMALADLIRSQRLIVSEEALAFLGAAVAVRNVVSLESTPGSRTE